MYIVIYNISVNLKRKRLNTWFKQYFIRPAKYMHNWSRLQYYHGLLILNILSLISFIHSNFLFIYLFIYLCDWGGGLANVCSPNSKAKHLSGE